MENKNILLILLCTLFFLGCQNNINPEITAISTEDFVDGIENTTLIPSTDPPNTSILAESNTPESTQLKTTPTPSITPLPIEEPGAVFACSSDIENTDNFGNATGMLLFKDGSKTSVIIVDLGTRDVKKLHEDTLHSLDYEFISPDRKSLVFHQATFQHDTTDYSGTPWVFLSEELGLFSSSVGFQEISFQDRWQYLKGWLDNENLVFSRSAPFALVFNPFSTEWHEFSIDAPNRYWNNYDRFKIVLNPTRNLFVYLHDIESKFVVWDWDQWQPVSEIPLGGIYWYENAEYAEAYAPIWLQNGEKFILVAGQSGGANANDEIFMVGIDGSSRAITKFRDFSERISISPISLSPDGSKVAFWYSKDPSEMDSSILTIVDIDSGDITELCSTSLLNEATAPIWSPDNQYLLFSLENQDAFIISVGTKESYFVTDEMTPIGWLKK